LYEVYVECFNISFNYVLLEHVEGRGKVYTGFWWGNMMEKDHLEDPGVDGRIILRWIIGMWDVEHGLCRVGSG